MEEEDLVREERLKSHPAVKNDTNQHSWVGQFLRERRLHQQEELLRSVVDHSFFTRRRRQKYEP